MLDEGSGIVYNVKSDFRNGPVVQLVRTLACHARGRGFESLPGRHCGFSSSGRAPPCQGGGSEFEPRNPLQALDFSQIGLSRAFVRGLSLRFFCVFMLVLPRFSVLANTLANSWLTCL